MDILHKFSVIVWRGSLTHVRHQRSFSMARFGSPNSLGSAAPSTLTTVLHDKILSLPRLLQLRFFGISFKCRHNTTHHLRYFGMSFMCRQNTSHHLRYIGMFFKCRHKHCATSPHFGSGMSYRACQQHYHFTTLRVWHEL